MKKEKIGPILAFLFLAGLIQAQIIDIGKDEACKVIDWIKLLLELLIIALVVFSGYQIMTAGGDAGSLEKAKTRLIFVLIGGAIIYSAKALVNQVLHVDC